MEKNYFKPAFIVVAMLSVSLLLTSCDSSNYQKANELFDNGDYTSALELYSELGEYEDSQERIQMCKYAIANEHLDSEEYIEQLHKLRL